MGDGGRHISLFRMDRRNVGDWWSPPVRYFPLKARSEVDMIGDLSALKDAALVIVGGGGLAQEGAMGETIRRLASESRGYKLIAWGVGADGPSDRGGLLTRDQADPDLYRRYDGFDTVGTRIFSETYGGDSRYRWVPCASSMHPLFLELRQTRPTRSVGLYAHRRVPIRQSSLASVAKAKGQKTPFGKLPRNDNTGLNIEAKLRFLAQFEYVVSNSYHGVFWATLLGRKAICPAFKNGLFTFKHPPAYYDPAEPDRAFDEAVVHPDALDECRAANIGFYRFLTETYGDI